MADEPKAAPAFPPLRDDPGAPVFFVDELTGGGPSGDTFNMTFARMQYDYAEGGVRAYRQVVARIVIPISALQMAGAFISESLAKHRPQDAPAPAPPIPSNKLN